MVLGIRTCWVIWEETTQTTQKEDESNQKELYERVHAGVTKAPVKCSVIGRKSCSEGWRWTERRAMPSVALSEEHKGPRWMISCLCIPSVCQLPSTMLSADRSAGTHGHACTSKHPLEFFHTLSAR